MVKQNQRTTFGQCTTVEPVHFSAPGFPSLLSLLSGRRQDGAGTAPANRANHSVNTALGRWDGKIHHSRALTLSCRPSATSAVSCQTPPRRQPHWPPRQWVPSVSICVHLWLSPCPPAGEFPFHSAAPPQPEIACDSLSQLASFTCDSLSQLVFSPNLSQVISGHLNLSQAKMKFPRRGG
jgi:hypothetical protein